MDGSLSVATEFCLVRRLPASSCQWSQSVTPAPSRCIWTKKLMPCADTHTQEKKNMSQLSHNVLCGKRAVSTSGQYWGMDYMPRNICGLPKGNRTLYTVDLLPVHLCPRYEYNFYSNVVWSTCYQYIHVHDTNTTFTYLVYRVTPGSDRALSGPVRSGRVRRFQDFAGRAGPP